MATRMIAAGLVLLIAASVPAYATITVPAVGTAQTATNVEAVSTKYGAAASSLRNTAVRLTGPNNDGAVSAFQSSLGHVTAGGNVQAGIQDSTTAETTGATSVFKPASTSFGGSTSAYVNGEPYYARDATVVLGTQASSTAQNFNDNVQATDASVTTASDTQDAAAIGATLNKVATVANNKITVVPPPIHVPIHPAQPKRPTITVTPKHGRKMLAMAA